jgi:DNA-binding transcriptional MerR regulator
MENSGLKIGGLAGRSGVSAKAIRFYEAAGVLPPPARGANGYRLYATDAVDMLRFIKQAQGLGFTLAEIKDIVAIRRGGRPPCRHVYKMLREKVAELDRKLHDLVLLRRRMRQSLAAWGRRPLRNAVVCPHIEGSAGASRRRSQRR